MLGRDHRPGDRQIAERGAVQMDEIDLARARPARAAASRSGASSRSPLRQPVEPDLEQLRAAARGIASGLGALRRASARGPATARTTSTPMRRKAGRQLEAVLPDPADAVGDQQDAARRAARRGHAHRQARSSSASGSGRSSWMSLNASKACEVALMRPLPRPLVGRAEARVVVGRAGIGEQRHRVVGPDALAAQAIAPGVEQVLIVVRDLEQVGLDEGHVALGEDQALGQLLGAHAAALVERRAALLGHALDARLDRDAAGRAEQLEQLGLPEVDPGLHAERAPGARPAPRAARAAAGRSRRRNRGRSRPGRSAGRSPRARGRAGGGGSGRESAAWRRSCSCRGSRARPRPRRPGPSGARSKRW